MARFKKNQVNQIMFTMVDKTDFATVELALAASDLKVRLYGLDHAGSAAASTISLAVAKQGRVASGIYRGIFQMNKDQVMFRVSSLGTTSCALQFLEITQDTYDDTDTYSMASNYLSNASNYLSKINSFCQSTVVAASTVASKVWAVKAYTSGYGSIVFGTSTFGSLFVVGHPSLLSNIGSQVWANALGTAVYNTLTPGQSKYSVITSDIASMVWGVKWDIHSAASTFGSAFETILSNISTIQVNAAAAASRALLCQSRVSDIASQVWGGDIGDNAGTSTFGSRFNLLGSNAKAAASRALLVQSRTSDIASQVWAADVSDNAAASSFGSVMTARQISINSRVLLVMSRTSDIASQVWAADKGDNAAASSFGSKLWSAITAGPAAANVVSTARAVWQYKYNAADIDDASMMGSLIERVGSKVIVFDTPSNIASNVWKFNYATAPFTTGNTIGSVVLYRASTVSKIYSGLNAAATASAVAAAVWNEPPAGHSGATTPLSMLKSAIANGPTNALTASNISDIAQAVWKEDYTFASNLTSSSFGSAFRVAVSTLSTAGVNAAAAASRALLVQSRVSDIASQVWAGDIGDNAGGSTFGSRFNLLASNAKAASSRALLNESMISVTQVQATAAASRALLVQSRVSDIASQVWAGDVGDNAAASSFGSRITRTFSMALLTVSRVSDIASMVWAADIGDNAGTSTFGSRFNLLGSNAKAAASRVLLVQSRVSDIGSQVWAADIGDNKAASTFGSTMSRIHSMAVKLASRVTVPVATQSKLGVVQGYASGAEVAAEQGSSRTLLVQSRVSDIASQVWAADKSDNAAASSFGSMLWTAIAAGPATANTTSIAKAVWQLSYSLYGSGVSQYGSLVRVLKTNIPGLVATSSHLDTTEAKIESHVSGITATIDKTAVASAVWANAIGVSAVSDIGTIKTQATAAASRALLVQSRVSDIGSQVWAADVGDNGAASSFGSRVTQINSRILVIKSGVSDIGSQVWAADWGDNQAASSFGSRFRLIASNADSAASCAFQANSRTLVILSRVSDIDSQVWSYSKGVSTLSTLSDLQRALDSQYTHVYSAVQAGGLNSAALVNIADAVWDEKWHDHSLVSTVGSRFEVLTSNVSDIHSAVLDSFVDGTTLTTNSLRDRLRTYGWVLRNRLKVNDTTGAGTLYKDDGTTTAFAVTAQFTDNGVSTVRKRYE